MLIIPVQRSVGPTKMIDNFDKERYAPEIFVYRYEKSQKLEHFIKQPFTELNYQLTSDKNYVFGMFFGVNTGEIQPYCGAGI